MFSISMVRHGRSEQWRAIFCNVSLHGSDQQSFLSYKCKAKPVQMRDGVVVFQEGEFILNQVQGCFICAKWQVMTSAGSELLILEKPSKSNWSANHSLDSQSHIALLYRMCGPETSPLCLPKATFTLMTTSDWSFTSCICSVSRVIDPGNTSK